MAVAVTATHVGSEKLASEIRAAVEHTPADHEGDEKRITKRDCEKPERISIETLRGALELFREWAVTQHRAPAPKIWVEIVLALGRGQPEDIPANLLFVLKPQSAPWRERLGIRPMSLEIES